MAMPADVPVVDLMMGIPEGHKKDWYAFLRKGFMDSESGDMEFPVQYMFKDVPKDIDETADPVKVVLDEMDHFNIERAMLGIGGRATPTHRSSPARPVQGHPPRVFPTPQGGPKPGPEG